MSDHPLLVERRGTYLVLGHDSKATGWHDSPLRADWFWTIAEAKLHAGTLSGSTIVSVEDAQEKQSDE